jgi:hypothetical protein
VREEPYFDLIIFFVKKAVSHRYAEIKNGVK